MHCDTTSRNQNRHAWRPILTLVLAAGMLGGYAVGPHTFAHAKTVAGEHHKLHRILAKRDYWVHRLKAEQAQEAQLEKQLAGTQGQLNTQQSKLNDEKARFAAQRAQLDRQIQVYQHQVDSIRTQIHQGRVEYHAVHKAANVLLLRLKVLRKRIHAEMHNVRSAIVQLYDLSLVPPLEQVLEAHSLTSLLQQQSFVSEIGAHDTAVLERARRQHAKVRTLVAGYLRRMEELKAIRRQKKAELALIVVQTQHEDLLLLKAQRLTDRRQANINAEKQTIANLGSEEQDQINNVAALSESDKQRAHQQQTAAEKVAFIIGEQTGNFPNIGGLGVLRWPAVGPIAQPFGPTPYKFEPPLTYNGVYYPHFHTGIDIDAPFQSPIRAAAAGKVIFASLFVPGRPHLSYGLCVIIEHSKHLSTLYAHMDLSMGLQVHVGQFVTRGQVVGYEGVTGNTTGPHLHFEVRVNGQFEDPMKFLPPEPRY